MQKYTIFAFLLILSCGGYNNNSIFYDDYKKPDKLVGEPLYSALDQLTNKLVSGMTERAAKTVVVGEFLNLDGSVMMFGRFIAEKLIAHLYETKRFRVIERNRLDQVLNEIQLSQTGVIEPDLAKRLGQLLGADAIVTGTLTDIGGGFDVNARIIDTQTGDVFAVATTVIAKDETVINILKYGYVRGPENGSWNSNNGDNVKKPLAGVFKSAVEIDTKVLIKLEPVYELARKKLDLELVGDCLIWKNFGPGNHIAYLHRNGKIILLSKIPLESQDQMDIFRSEYVTISNIIIEVNADMDKAIRNHAWKRDLTVYNYERNSYKRLMGYLRGKAVITIPSMSIKQASLFVFADGWNNRVYLKGDRIAQWRGKGSKHVDITKFMYFGEHEIEIKQYGGSKPFFIFQFFAEASPLNIEITNNADLHLRDSVDCYSIDDLVLP